MTTKRTLTILHHPAQEKQAQNILSALRAGPLRIKTITSCSTDLIQDDKTLVLLSDNFLRDIACMEYAPELLPQLERQNKLITIITPGFRQTENGQAEEFPTQIQRTKDFMQYINFWQQRYLELRREKRTADKNKLPKIEEQLKTVRNISANIGNFFNFLRALDLYQPEEIKQDNFKKLFELLDLEEDHPAFAKIAQSHDTETEMPPSDTNTPAISDDDDEAPGSLHETPLLPSDDEEKADMKTDDIQKESDEVLISTQVNTPTEQTDESEHCPEDENEKIPSPSQQETEEEYSIEELLQKARELREKDEQEKALQLLRQGTSLYPYNAEIRYRYALLLIEVQKDAQAARAELKEAISLKPERNDIRFLLAELSEYLDKPKQALKHYRKIVKREPKQAEAWQRMALLYASFFPEKKQAGRCYQKAAQLNPDNADLQFLYAQYLQETEAKPKKIIKALKETLRRNHQHAAAHFQLAQIYAEKRKTDKAQAHYLMAIQQQPDLKTTENDQLFLKTDEEIPPSTSPQENKEKKPQQKAFGESPSEKEETTTKQPESKTAPVALITGASSGIGMETARRLAKAGYHLILCARRKDRLQLLQKELQDACSVEVITLAFDIRKYEDCKQAYSKLEGKWKKIQVLINNAGLARGLHPIHEGRIDDWETMIDTNIKGLLYMTRLISPGMVERRKGHIINISSTAGKEVYPNGNVYCATKFAVEALTKAMRIDLYQYGIKVGQVSPGHVETEFAQVRFDWDEERAKIYEDFTPLRPEDVAELVFFLINQPEHVNIQDVLVMAKQQAGSNFIDRSGKL